MKRFCILTSIFSYCSNKVFNNDALWPTYSTTLATSQLPTIPQSTEGWQTAASTSYTTSRQPPQFPPVTTFRSFARTSQSRTSQSRTSQSPTSGESEGTSMLKFYDDRISNLFKLAFLIMEFHLLTGDNNFLHQSSGFLCYK